jgi:hypothetical protein
MDGDSVNRDGLDRYVVAEMSKRGKPLLATTIDNRCEAATVMTEWKKARKREERCPFMAKWAVQGHQFCMHHARIEAVAICVEKGYAKRIYAPPTVAGQRAKIASSK